MNKKQKFYNFTQNNSGGRLITNDKLSHRVFIEAIDKEEAFSRAESVGIYFDGCDSGQDCSCCGDRWSRYAHELTFPHRYGTFDLEKAKNSGIKYKKTTWRFMGTEKPDPSKYDLIFDDIESFAKFLEKEHPYCSDTEREYSIFPEQYFSKNQNAIILGRLGGKSKSPAKIRASKKNGKKNKPLPHKI